MSTDKNRQVEIFDSTLRDGAQGEGIAFTVEDKLKVVETLDNLGVKYIEAGNPGSNPKDLEFFKRVKNITLQNSAIVAFGSTRRRDINVEDDANVKSLLTADTKYVAIFGKSWDLHVKEIIKTTLEENLKMIEETLSFFVNKGKTVIYDAEHFFDGYKNNPEYAMKTLEAAIKGGAAVLALCDTNGGCFPTEIYDIANKVVKAFPNAKVGIHCHNDSGLAVANSLMAVAAGAGHVQGTYNGFGERCGNANLSTVIADLQLKKGYICIPEENVSSLTDAAHRIASIANMILDNGMPFVGKSAFAHKGGMHIDGVNKVSRSFEHIDPQIVGNERRFLMSEVSGRSTIISKLQNIDPTLEKDSPETQKILKLLKEKEHRGYQYEAAEASFELLVLKALGRYKPFFDLAYFKTTGDKLTTHGSESRNTSTAIISLIVGGENEITAAEGDGPVNALDLALRKALEVFYPALSSVQLTDYRVRVMEAKNATASKVRVLIESTDGEKTWSTVGVSTDIIQASWKALVDSIEYKLIKDLNNA
ncbi:MAG: citramalate synthase [Bacillota bacterium]|nr:citramalate synthase [Bacillota bacterium]